MRVELSEIRIFEKYTAPWHALWHEGQRVSYLQHYSSWQNTVIINYTLQKLRADGYFTGLVKVVGDFLLGYDGCSVSGGTRRFDRI